MMKHFGSQTFWVTAEIAKVNQKGGHRYLELVDSENGITSALIAASIWRRNYQNIYERVGQDLNDIVKTGNKALFQIKIEYHKIYGLKLNVLDIDPTYSYGEIERKKQETIKRLKDQGLFDLQKQLELPIIAKRIALVGSPGTSGYRDFTNELLHNNVYRNFVLKEFAASVQGDRSVQEIIKAIETARLYDVDAIVLIRGGGSKMDLNVFNDYDIAKTICETQIPVITGIGHESDEVVADLVGKQRCITPTAAAKYFYIRIGNFSAELRNAFDAIKQQSLGLLGAAKDEFYHQNRYLAHFSQQLLLEHQHELRTASHNLQLGFLNLIHSEKSELSLSLKQLSSRAIHQLQLIKEADLPARLERIQMMSKNLIDQKKLEVKGLEELLRMLDPQRLLENGYTISTINDMDLNLVTENLVGKEMKTLSSTSLISSKITKTENRK